jgi:hypothetical protein
MADGVVRALGVGYFVQWPVRTALSLLLAVPLGIVHAQNVEQVVQPAPKPAIRPAGQSSPQAVDPPSPNPTTQPVDPSLAPAVPGDPESPRDKATVAPVGVGPAGVSPPAAIPADEASKDPNVPYHWLDRTHQVLYDTMWRSAEHVDRWFGSSKEDAVYQQIFGSMTPALLYTQYDGMRAQLRFNMNIPLPQVSDRFHAFVGRFDPNEFITERDEPSGAFPRTYGPQTEDQTLLGIGYHEPPRHQEDGGHFDAGAGIRIALPMDPFVKGSYVYQRGTSETGLFSIRETIYWQRSDGVGATTRLDLQHVYDVRWLLRYTASATRSQESQGMRGYTSILALRSLAPRRAIAFEVGIDAETQAPVPIHDYGMKVAYRQGILRKFLVMEIRTSIDWPRDFTYQRRSASVGVGIGFEMLFGTSQFLARPITF